MSAEVDADQLLPSEYIRGVLEALLGEQLVSELGHHPGHDEKVLVKGRGNRSGFDSLGFRSSSTVKEGGAYALFLLVLLYTATFASSEQRHRIRATDPGPRSTISYLVLVFV